jgi:hypothetical protein
MSRYVQNLTKCSRQRGDGAEIWKPEYRIYNFSFFQKMGKMIGYSERYVFIFLISKSCVNKKYKNHLLLS